MSRPLRGLYCASDELRGVKGKVWRLHDGREVVVTRVRDASDEDGHLPAGALDVGRVVSYVRDAVPDDRRPRPAWETRDG